jgi:hypothetical protein
MGTGVSGAAETAFPFLFGMVEISFVCRIGTMLLAKMKKTLPSWEGSSVTLCDAACASTFSNHNRLPVYYYDPKHDNKQEANQGGNSGHKFLICCILHNDN